MTVVPLYTKCRPNGSVKAKFRGAAGWRGKWFAIVPGRAIFDQRLRNGDLRCLNAMAAYASESRLCRTPQTTIAKRLGCYRQSVNRSVNRLVSFGYLEVVGQTLRPGGGNGAKVYRITEYEVVEDKNGLEFE